MKQMYWIFVSALFLLFACNTEQNKDPKMQMKDHIASLEQGVFNDQVLEYNKDTALFLIKAYQNFIDQYPEDTVCKNYAYLNAQLTQSIKLYGEAIRKYQAFYNKYPQDERAPKAQILAGMIYESNLKDTVKAKEIYTSFLKNYPNHPMAEDIRLMIQYLSLSDQELMNMLKKKSQNH